MKAIELIKILSAHPNYDITINGIEFNAHYNHNYSGELTNLKKDMIHEKNGSFEIQGFWDEERRNMNKKHKEKWNV